MGKAPHTKVWILKRDGIEIARGSTQEEIYLKTGIGKSVISAIFRGCYDYGNLSVEKVLIPRENVWKPKYKHHVNRGEYCISVRGDKYKVHPYFSEEVVMEYLNTISSLLGRPVTGYRVVSIHATREEAILALKSLGVPEPTPTVSATLFDRDNWLTKEEYHEWQGENHTCERCGISGSSAKFHNRHHDKCSGLKIHKGRRKG